MRSAVSFLVVAVSLVALLGCVAPQPADLILLDGNIHTVDPARAEAEALAARDGRIVYVGSDRGARRFRGPYTEVVVLNGASVYPGFVDAHMHLENVGTREMQLNLEGSDSLGDLIRQVAERVEHAAPGEWIVGRGWIETFWSPPRFPTRQDLDTVAPDNPVWLTRVDGHGAVANSMALKIGRVTAATPDPFGGQILRDEDSGEPTGMLLDAAQSLVATRIPPKREADRLEALKIGARVYAECGWTGVQVAGNSWKTSEAIRSLVQSGEIPIRVYNAVRGPGRDADHLLEEGALIDATDGSFTRRTIKVSLDGALGSGGAALLEPYSDRPGNGFLTQKDTEMQDLLVRALRRGIQVEVHAIGDRANRKILDLYEEAFEKVPAEERGVAAPRWRVEHAQILDPADLPRFAALDVIPSMQPSHAITDLHFASGRIGDARLGGAYAWRSLIDSGVIIPGGSDAPVERGDPRIEFYAAVARRDLRGFQGENWHPEQAVTRDEALKMFTIWAAEAAFQEDRRGSITVGKDCDLTIFNADIMTISEEEIPKVDVVMTVVAGKIVHRRGGD